ncbi:MAG: T9SS type A sorting domain-containing protein [Bacteroidetes bacterium]|nr:MAG: T9SS type A sorting domain-containing protein [Bacteroidota bacterium]
MKRLFTILFMLLGSLSFLSAQQSFNVSATEVWSITSLMTDDNEAHFDITNRSAAVQTIRWERTVIDITSGCNSQVCDLVQCYIPSVSTKTFEIDPNFTGPIIMHFLNPDTLPEAGAIIRLKMSNVNIPEDSVTVTFLYTSPLSGTNDLPQANVKLFPNPTTDYFQLENADAVQRIRVFSLDNREVARFTAAPGERYSLATQPAGVYMLALEDSKGRVFQAMEVVKR